MESDECRLFGYVTPVAVNSVNERIALCMVLLFSLLLRYMSRLQYETHIVFRVRCPIFLSDFNQIWIQSTELDEGVQYQNSRISNEGERS